MDSDSSPIRILIASSNPGLTAECAKLIRQELNCHIYECYSGLHFSQQLELTAGYDILMFLSAPEIQQIFKSKFLNYQSSHILIYNQISDVKSELPTFLKTLNFKNSERAFVAIHYKLLLHYGHLPIDIYAQKSMDGQIPYLKANTMVTKTDLIKLGQELFYIRAVDVEKISRLSEKSIEASLLELSLQNAEIYDFFKHFKSMIRTQVPSVSQKICEEFDPHFIKALKLCCKDSEIKKKLEKKLYANPYFPIHMYLIGLISYRLALLAKIENDLNHTLLAFCGLLHDLALSTDDMEEFELIFELESGNYDQSRSISENLLHHGEETVGWIIDIENLPDWVSEILLKHHERPMGVGFPVGEDIGHYDGELAIFILAHILIDNIYIAKNAGKPLENVFKFFSLDHLKNGPIQKIAQNIEKLDIFNN